MKVFQIGFNRCGTTSIHQFFEANGMRSVHHDKGRLALTMDANLRHGRHILSGYEHYDAYTDMELLLPSMYIEAYKLHNQILEQVPGARFILNVRDVDRWVASRLRLQMIRDSRMAHALNSLDWPPDAPKLTATRWHRRASYAETYMSAHGLANMSDVVRHWKSEWETHINQVKQDIPADRLLVFDIESGSPLSLCQFVGLDDSAALHYEHENATMGVIGKFLVYWTPNTVLRLIPKAVKRSARHILQKS